MVNKNAVLYFKANNVKGRNFDRFIKSLNKNMSNPNNFFLAEKIEKIAYGGSSLIIVPLFLNFPFFFFPLSYIGLSFYCVVLLLKFRFQDKGKGLRPVSSRYAAGVLYEEKVL